MRDWNEKHAEVSKVIYSAYQENQACALNNAWNTPGKKIEKINKTCFPREIRKYIKAEFRKIVDRFLRINDMFLHIEFFSSVNCKLHASLTAVCFKKYALVRYLLQTVIK